MTDRISHLPPDHPAIPPRRIGVLLVNLGTPDATDYWSMRRYLKEFLSDRRVIEENRDQVVAGAQPHHPDRAPGPQGPRLRQDLEQRAQRIRRSRPSRARSPTSWRRCSTRSTSASASTGRCATAIRRSARGWKRWPRRIAIASCWCRFIRNTPPPPPRRSATRRSARSRRCAGSRRCGCAAPYYAEPAYIDALAASLERGLGEAYVQAGRDPRLVSRHAGRISAQGRSLLLPLRQDHAAVARAAQARRETG